MSLDLTSVVAALRFLLLEVGNAATAAAVELPERQYVTTAGAVYDCAQVTVSANQIRTGVTGAESSGAPVSGCGPGWQADIEISIVRCAKELPEGRSGNKPPTVENIELDTVEASKDASILTTAVERVAGPGWDQYGQVPASIQFGEVEGGLFAVVLSVTLNLWSFPPEEPTP